MLTMTSSFHGNMHSSLHGFLDYVKFGKKYILLPTVWENLLHYNVCVHFISLINVVILSSWVYDLYTVNDNEVKLRNAFGVGGGEAENKGGRLLTNMEVTNSFWQTVHFLFFFFLVPAFPNCDSYQLNATTFKSWNWFLSTLCWKLWKGSKLFWKISS